MTDGRRLGLVFAILTLGALVHAALSMRDAGWLGAPRVVHLPGRFEVRGETVDGYTHLDDVAAWLQHELPAETPVTALAEHAGPHHWLRYLAYPREVGFVSFPNLPARLERSTREAQAFVVLPPPTAADEDPFTATRKVRGLLQRAWPAAEVSEPFRGATGVTVLVARRP